MKWPLRNKTPFIPVEGSVGDFAYKRSFYYHSGIDLYCDFGQEVQAIEDGIISHIEQFTGVDAIPTSPWWNDTWAIMIEGKSGAIGYCELKVADTLTTGSIIKAGDIIGHIIPVMKKEKIKGILNMLHIEHYLPGTVEHATWMIDTEKPADLLNPRELLNEILQHIK